MFLIGGTSSKGTYYWYSQHHNGWVVADLDLGKASLHNKLALIDAPNYIAAELENKLGLGQEGDKWLIDGDELVPFLREYNEYTEVLMVYYQDGSQKPYGKLEQEISQIVKKIKKKRESE